MNRLEKMMHKERYMRNGAIQLNLLKYDIVWVVSRWGFIGKENCCEFFKFVAELFTEDKDVKKASGSKKESGSKKAKEQVVAKTEAEASEEPSVLPATEESAVAKADTKEAADEERKELL